MTLEELQAAGVRAAALVFVDNAGITRMKCVPVDRLARAAETGVGMSLIWGGVMGNDLFVTMPGDPGPSGELRLVADLGAAAPLACAPGWAWAPVDQREQDGSGWDGCARTFLRRMVGRAAVRGIDILAAWELEWTVGRESPEGFETLHGGPGYGAATFGDTAALMLSILESGLEIEQIHPEYSPGQMELSLSPADPLRACDASVLARHVVHTVARQAGWRASFAPIVASTVGNGQHLHFSVWADGANQFAGGEGPARLRPAGESFLAGVLSALPALTAIGAPTALSYLRLQPSHWAGVYTCWGVENREATLRLEGALGPNAASSANVEWKTPDGAANPYLALGAVIAAGLDGFDRRLRLPLPVSADPAAYAEEDRRAAGIFRLPKTLSEAAEALAGSAVLEAGMGGYLHECVVSVRRGEAQAAAGGLADEGSGELLRLLTETTPIALTMRRRLAERLGCEPTREAVAAARRAALAADPTGYSGALFRDANVAGLVYDEGYPQPTIPRKEFAAAAGARVHRVCRIEPHIAALRERAGSYGELEEAFVAELERAADDPETVAFKSVIAYRTGLDVGNPGPDECERAFARWRADDFSETREHAKPVRDALLRRTLEVARREDRPVHVHCGGGDPAIVLAHARPQDLFPLLVEHAGQPVVLIHSGWPWIEEGAFVASVLPNVYLDVSVMLPWASLAVDQKLEVLLGAAPPAKVLYGSDEASEPEVIWLAAQIAREALGRVLGAAVERRWLDEHEALEIGEGVLAQNARRLHGIAG